MENETAALIGRGADVSLFFVPETHHEFHRRRRCHRDGRGEVGSQPGWQKRRGRNLHRGEWRRRLFRLSIGHFPARNSATCVLLFNFYFSPQRRSSQDEDGDEDGGLAAGFVDTGELREQDRFLPIANVARIMKKAIPAQVTHLK